MVPLPSQPIRPGLTISQKGFGLASGGTIGCFMIDRKTGGVVLVSNQHVLNFFQASFFSLSGSEKDAQLDVIQPDGGEINSFVLTCDSTSKVGNAYAQLGLFQTKFNVSEDDTTRMLQDRLATDLAERCVVARFDRGQLEGELDVAVARVVPGVYWANTFPDGTIMKPPPPDDSYLEVGMTVRKWGARSGAWKTGKITKVGTTAEVGFGSTGQKTVPMPTGTPSPTVVNKLKLNGLIEVTGDDPNATFQMQGDSGSSLCLDDGTLIGILSSGGLGRLAYACSIWSAMETFGLSFPLHQKNVVYPNVKSPTFSHQVHPRFGPIPTKASKLKTD